MSNLPIRSAAPASLPAPRSDLRATEASATSGGGSSNSNYNQNNIQYHTMSRPNPRRRPAQEAVSLKHDIPLAQRAEPTAAKQSHAQRLTSQPSSLAANGDSSGESSNVDAWFEKSNKNVLENQNTINDSPPAFFFQNSSTESSNEPAHLKTTNYSPPFAATVADGATGATGAGLTSSGSSSEEYRSVIDDLTIQNKKLRSKLKKYERIHDPKLEGDRLFEVKVYGLSASKKRELEETLRKFATSLHESPTAVPSAHSTVPSSTAQASESKSLSTVKSQGAPDHVQMAKPTSSMSSTRVADSGYGSLTTFSPSAQSSGIHQMHPAANAANAAPSMQQASSRPPQVESAKARNNEINSYLSDIPKGLRPKVPQAMTEHERKKTVVRRLEQIFGGRVAAPGEHRHPMQQQEVSQSAARADRPTSDAQGYRSVAEGDREAHIMETEEPMNNPTKNNRTSGDEDNEADNDMDHQPQHTPEDQVDEAEHKNESLVGLEQRPTRPLDLDPDRAQMPAENMDYLRHLGFTVTDIQASPIYPPPMGDWVYLNVLVNMAQLHTINVTTEFVKNAVATHSTKLELSSDGRKVRWKGGSNMTRFSSQDGSASSTPCYSSSNANEPRSRGKKRNRPAHLERGDGSFYNDFDARKKQATTSVGNSDDRFAYKPLFKHGEEDSDESDSDLSSEDADAMPSETSMLSHQKDTPLYSMSNGAAKRREYGPIIFYNNSTFCTDLSGDTSGTCSKVQPSSEHWTSTRFPIGMNADAAASEAERVAAAEARRPLMEAKLSPQDPDAMQVEGGADTPVSLNMSQFSIDTSSAKSITFADMDRVIEFEASGIGGVYPADNLRIEVVRQQQIGTTYETSSKAFNMDTAPLPKLNRHRRLAKASRVAPVLPKSPKADRAPRVTEAVLKTRAVKLPPSALPPAIYAFGDDEHDSNAGSDSDNDDDSSSQMEGTGLAVAGTATIASTFGPRRMDIDVGDESEYEDEEDEDDEDDDNGNQSIDFLSTARKVNPEVIRAREREYDADMADRLAEEIPAGSSAATAGGGSGFNSPVDIVARHNEEKQAQKGKEGADKVNAVAAADEKVVLAGSVSS